MNKQYFCAMFCANKGKVYRVVNDLPSDTAKVTEQFITDAGTDLISIVVVHLENDCVVYSDLADTVVSEYFEEIADLSPEIEPIVEAETPPVEEPVDGGTE